MRDKGRRLSPSPALIHLIGVVELRSRAVNEIRDAGVHVLAFVILFCVLHPLFEYRATKNPA
jgi:hypothetical protein